MKKAFILFLLLILGLSGCAKKVDPKISLDLGTVNKAVTASAVQDKKVDPVADFNQIKLKNIDASKKNDATKPPQFILLSFDGSQSLPIWEETRSFAKKMTAENKPLNFTYFISGVYFLEPQFKDLYIPPGEKPGTSRIGFAYSKNDVFKRIDEINGALAEGNEIGSHLNGHFDGSNWQEKDWTEELNSFDNLVFNLYGNNQISADEQAAHQLKLTEADVVGLRAPNLAIGQGLSQALKTAGYKYDASRVVKANTWPYKDANGIWIFGFTPIKNVVTNRYLLPLDYNFFVAQSDAKDVVKKTDPAWQEDYDAMYQSYLNYFNNSYNGNRTPLFITGHFSLWNDRVYFEAMKAFANEVCGLPDVRCTTFSTLMNYLENNNPKK